LRYGAILLNLFMIATTPIQGAHYFIDLVGGTIVAVAAIYVAVRFMGGRERVSQPQDVPPAQEAEGMPAVIKLQDRGPARSLGGACL
jgi:membrane-associated phospholipid phosphatase